MRCRQAELRCMLGGMIDEPSLPMIAGRPDGCVHGRGLYMATTVAAVWIPLVAMLIPANRADDEEAPALICRLPAEVGVVLGDVRYADPDPHALRAARDRILATTKHGPDPHTDPGVEVRCLFHALRSRAWRTSTPSSRRSSAAWTRCPPAARVSEAGDDSRLTELGCRQATDAARELAVEPITRIYASTLRRARQTAELLATTPGLRITAVPELVEAECNAGVLRAWVVDRDLGRRAADGETGHQVLARVTAALQKIVDAPPARPSVPRRVGRPRLALPGMACIGAARGGRLMP
jgi:hypothetical protein